MMEIPKTGVFHISFEPFEYTLSNNPSTVLVFLSSLVSQNQDGHVAASENGTERTMKHLNGNFSRFFG